MSRRLLASLLLAFALVQAVGLGQEPEEKKENAFDGLKALKHPDPQVRYDALVTLARLGPAARFAGPHLREALTDKNSLVRVKAAEALWKVEQPQASVVLPTLTQALSDRDAAARTAAAGVLAQLGERAKPALPRLVAALRDPDVGVRLEAAAALGQLGPMAVSAAPALLDLAGSPDFLLLEPIVGASLTQLGSGAVPSLTQALVSDSAARRRLAVYALGSMGDVASAAPAFAARLQDDDPGVRRLAVRALGKLGPKAAEQAPALAALAAQLDARSPALRLEAVLALWQVRGEAHLEPVRASLRDQDAGLRAEAARLVARIGRAAKGLLPELARALGDEDAGVRAAAAEALGSLQSSGTDAVAQLKRALGDDDAFVKVHAAFSLWQITGQTQWTLTALENALAENDSVLQRKVLGQFAAMKEAAQPSLPTLVELYREETDAGLRAAFAEALRAIDPQTAKRLGLR